MPPWKQQRTIHGRSFADYVVFLCANAKKKSRSDFRSLRQNEHSKEDSSFEELPLDLYKTSSLAACTFYGDFKECAFDIAGILETAESYLFC